MYRPGRGEKGVVYRFVTHLLRFRSNTTMWRVHRAILPVPARIERANRIVNGSRAPSEPATGMPPRDRERACDGSDKPWALRRCAPEDLEARLTTSRSLATTFQNGAYAALTAPTGRATNPRYRMFNNHSCHWKVGSSDGRDPHALTLRISEDNPAAKGLRVQRKLPNFIVP